jgi:hypothetical protein
MDTGAQQDTPDTGANGSGAGTDDDAGAGDKSAGIDKGRGPEVPEVRTDPAPASPGQATPAALEKPTPKTPTLEKSAAIPAKTGTFKMTQIIKTAPTPAKTAPASAKPAPSSSAMTLHTGKGAAWVSFFHTPELEGRVSLRTKSDKSLGSLKEYCMKWNDADYMDTASSKKKKLAGVPAPGNPDAIPAKPIAIASELSLYLPSPRKCRLSGIRTSGIFQYFF